MPAPAVDHARYFTRAAVLGSFAGTWIDVPFDDATVKALVENGILATTDNQGNPAPQDLPPRRCCGG